MNALLTRIVVEKKVNMMTAPESKQMDGDELVDDDKLLDMDACFTAFDKDG